MARRMVSVMGFCCFFLSGFYLYVVCSNWFEGVIESCSFFVLMGHTDVRRTIALGGRDDGFGGERRGAV